MKRIEIEKMSQKAIAASKDGDACVSVSRGRYKNPTTDEWVPYTNLSVIIDGVAATGDSFEEAMEKWAATRDEAIAVKVKAAKELLEQEGVL